MPYKTISLKLSPPTGCKREYLDSAIERYTDAFEFLLREVAPLVEETPSKSKNGYLKLLSSEIMEKTSKFGVEPFKDALKLDVAMTLSIYSGAKHSGKKVNYPSTRTYDEDLSYLLSGGKRENRKLSSALLKYQKIRPIFFCRFDKGRDYSLLFDGQTGRYYAKLYLFNRGEAKKSVSKVKRLRYLSKEEEFLEDSKGKCRYLLCPLTTGDFQEKHLHEIDKRTALPKSAQLLKTENGYYLNIRFWYEPKEEQEISGYLGVSRALCSDLMISSCSLDLQEGRSKEIFEKTAKGKNRLYALANRIVSIAKKNGYQIVLENLKGRRDNLEKGDRISPLSRSDYNILCDLISYKSELCGVNKPILVSAKGIFYRCPVCRTLKNANRIEEDKFLCVNCGYVGEVNEIGAKNLARTLIDYKNNKIRVNYWKENGTIFFSQKLLDICFKSKADQYANERFYKYLQDFINTPTNQLSKKKLSVIKKLLDSENLREQILYVRQKL